MTHGAPAKKNVDDDEEIIPPPDGGWGWAVVFGSFMIHIIGIYSEFNYYVCLQINDLMFLCL